jgi:hypothetical protein
MPTLLVGGLRDAARIDADARRLVAEIEDYLRVTAATPIRRIDQIAIPRIPATSSVHQAWDAEMRPPRRTVGDRLRRREAGPQPIGVAAHLRLVSRYITAHGWCQGALYDKRGRVCLLGAQTAVLLAGYGTATEVMAARGVLMREIHHGGRGRHTRLENWNDEPGRREGEVHRLLDTAAARAGYLR